MIDESMEQHIEEAGVVAVVMIESAEKAVPLAEALMEGGVSAIELTLRSDAALGALKQVSTNVPELLLGAGTVLTPDQVAQVQDAGASFAVAPGCNPRVIRAAQEANLPFAPGVCTPSDVESALELGCHVLKFFPAEPSGGLKFLQSMAAPFKHLGVRFIPLGGVGPANAESYLADPLMIAVGGSWLAPADAIANNDWQEITARAKAASELVASVRGS